MPRTNRGEAAATAAALGLTGAFVIAGLALTDPTGTVLSDPTPTVTVTAPPAPAPPPTPARPAPGPTPAASPTPAGVLAQVVRVVDGDTARVLVDGEEVALRFIGLDTPETVHPTKKVECYGPEASEEAKRLLPVGAQLRIEYDPTQGRTDRYDRHLVYLAGPAGIDYAEHMIGMGYGREYTYAKAYERQQTYRKAEEAAKEAGRGLWGACPEAG